MQSTETESSFQWWNRLKKNKLALTGLFILGFTFILAVSAYWIVPDHSPYANRMIVEIGGRKPGFKQSFLVIDSTPVKVNHFFSRSINGQKELATYIPITMHIEKGDTVIVQRFLDEGVTTEEKFTLKSGDFRFETKHFLLGTDKFGRDILSRLIIGTRVSLSVGLIAVLISLIIGVTLGAVAGYYGSKVDEAIMWLINVVWSMPTLLLVFAITMALGRGFWQVFIAVGLTLWVNVARVIRGQVKSIRELEYIDAARALGFSGFRIIGRHILPNVLGPIMVVAAANFASAIVIEAGLSFLGVGVQSPQPSWGLMIRENYNFIITHNPFLAIIPGIAIMILVLALNILGNGLRDALDVRS
ncbi:ABC transporter permease [Pollutibacter soli]|uniref:ABC transporter permease n=1 Tax=Pollutibacter soli TaxID=3034157 RepID=UPI0030139043